MSRATYDAEHTGPRWTYGLWYRPVGYAQVPDGWIVGSNRPHPEYNHGTIDYPRELTDEEVKSFQLEWISSTSDDPRSVWRRQWPNHCRTCGGTGEVQGRRLDGTFGLVECRDCTERDLCSRCGRELQEEDENLADAPCPGCGWEYLMGCIPERSEP